MSHNQPSRKPATRPARVLLFAALGDETRQSLVSKLSAGAPRSITQLSADSHLTRQAVTKHLRVLADAGLARSERCGRQTLYRLDPAPIAEMHQYLDRISRSWDDALAQLKRFVEGDE